MAERCIYCHGGFEGTDPSWACPGCGTRYHYVCRHEMRACGTIGCPSPDAVPGRMPRGGEGAAPGAGIDLAAPTSGGPAMAVAGLFAAAMAGVVAFALVRPERGPEGLPEPTPSGAEVPAAAASSADTEAAVAAGYRAQVLLTAGLPADALRVLEASPPEVASLPGWAAERARLIERATAALPEEDGDALARPLVAATADDVRATPQPDADPAPAAAADADAAEPDPAAVARDRELAEALSGIVADNLRQLVATPDVEPDLLADVIDRARAMDAPTPELEEALATAEARLTELRAAEVRQAFSDAVLAKRREALDALARGNGTPLLSVLGSLKGDPTGWAFVQEAAEAVAARRDACTEAERGAGELPVLHATLAGALRDRCPLPAGDVEGEFRNPADGSVLVWVPRYRHTPEVGYPGVFLGKTEVTRTQWLAFARATGRRARDVPADSAQLPASGVSFQDAAEYCAWAGLRLPSAEEWRLAAIGDDPNAASARIDEVLARLANTSGAQDGFVELAPVGSFPRTRSPDGCLDLIGNVSEWVVGEPSHVWASDGGASPGAFHVRMGASYQHGPGAAALGELVVPAADAGADAGFRVARGFWY